jgi:alginate O-acetyltransferase complex protein AlgI
MIEYLAYWICVPLALFVYWRMPPRFRPAFLGATSFAFVSAFEPQTALILAAIALCVWILTGAARSSGPLKWGTRLAIVLLVGALGWFKYLPALGQLADGYDFRAILLPLGISYFTFKLIHYVFERGRGTLPTHGFAEFWCFVFLVPIFTAGPIQRFDTFLTQRTDRWDHSLAIEGLTRIAHGLIKKFVFGAVIFWAIQRVNMGSVPAILANLQNVAPPRIWAFLILSYLYVYMDFAGYSDIAIGTSRLFGLRIMENFNWPVLAPNIGNLWKRWHMSLAGWCQTYIYMPMLGVTRNPYLAAVASFTVMGLWHAASLNWLAWGLYNSFGVAVFQWFGQTARRRKWAFVKTRAFAAASYPMTFLYFAGSFAFTMTDRTSGLWGAVRLLAKAVGLDLPAMT